MEIIRKKYIRCPHCGDAKAPMTAWRPERGLDPNCRFYQCERCGKLELRNDRPKIKVQGVRW